MQEGVAAVANEEADRLEVSPINNAHPSSVYLTWHGLVWPHPHPHRHPRTAKIQREAVHTEITAQLHNCHTQTLAVPLTSTAGPAAGTATSAAEGTTAAVSAS